MITAGLLQVRGAVPTTPLELVTHATTISKIVLAILVVLSLLSWAIIVAKWLELRGIGRVRDEFMRDFLRAQSLEQARGAVRHTPPSPFTRIFARAIEFVGEMRSAGVPVESTARGPLSGSQVEALRLLLDTEASAERDRLARFVPTLAVIASVSPLIGLLGTVLGVINAFIGIATQGSGNIGAVAPGVAEALVATAAALSVAIPAMFAYNIFASRLNRVETELEGIGAETIALMAREGRI